MERKTKIQRRDLNNLVIKKQGAELNRDTQSWKERKCKGMESVTELFEYEPLTPAVSSILSDAGDQQNASGEPQV